MKKPMPKEPADDRIHWVTLDHMCRRCGGRVLESVANKGMTPGGNPIVRCADCREQSTSMHGYEDICWCGSQTKGGRPFEYPYLCLPYSILTEKPWLKAGFREFGCDPDKGGDVGIMTRSSFERLEKAAADRNKGCRLVFEFPDEASRERFLEWWSGLPGLGESNFLRAEASRSPSIRRIMKFEYSGTFPSWGYDPEKHGPDKTIVGQQSAEPS